MARQIMRGSFSAFRLVNGFVLLALALLCLLPFYYVVMISFSDPLLVREGMITLLPRGFSLRAYQLILRQQIFFNALKVSVQRTAIGGAINLVMQCMTAYALSCRYLRGRKAFTLMVIFTMLFNGGIIPTFLIVRYTGLLDTFWALVIPNAISTWNVIILISFFDSIPDSIHESARIDGANDITIFLRLVIPLSIPAIAVIALYIAVSHWNALMDAVLYINKSKLKPLQSYLMDLVMRNQMNDMYATPSEQEVTSLSLQTAAIFASTVPILLVYPLVQRYFVSGLMIGAIKG